MKFLGIIIVSICILSCQNNDQFKPIDKNITTKVLLGKELFFDPILSKDKSVSCSSCHQPQYAFADNVKFSKGFGGRLGVRNTPTVMNTLSRSSFFHDGKALSLEEQAIGPIENPLEMNLTFAEAVKRIKDDKNYQYYFNLIYNNKPDSASILNALAEYQRSLESDGSSRYDLWMNDEDSLALTAKEKKGRDLFVGKAKCFDCHFGPDFTGDEFKNIGIYDGKHLTDGGRFKVTKDSTDLGKFKVPGLRNIALTAPYMHNGMFNTLAEVIDYYDNPYLMIKQPINMDSTMIEPLNLSSIEKEELIAFLKSLTDQNIPY